MADSASPLAKQRRLGISERWWLGLPLAAGVYATLKWGIPLIGHRLATDSPLFGPLASTLPALAPAAATVALAAWGILVIERRRDARRLDSQTGLDSIRQLSWREFEQLLATAFRRQGYRVVDTGPGPDGGIDLVLHDANGTIAVQAKHWKARKVGVEKVRELLGARIAAGITGAMLVTSGEATTEARRFAAAGEVGLIEGVELERMIREVQRRPIERSAPAPVEIAAPMCPRCGSGMVRRTARKGANAGGDFWGCSTFPQCRGTREVQ